MKRTPYSIPKNLIYNIPGQDTIEIWDIPGAGTPNFPVATYIADQGLRYFQGVLILTSTRCTQIDYELMAELSRFNVPWYYVRTKLDVDIDNELNDKGQPAEKTIENLRAYCTQAMRDVDPNLPADRFFLVSCRGPSVVGDWDRLTDTLMKDFVEHARPVVDFVTYREPLCLLDE
jgi:interferon gamma inducible protein 47